MATVDSDASMFGFTSVFMVDGPKPDFSPTHLSQASDKAIPDKDEEERKVMAAAAPIQPKTVSPTKPRARVRRSVSMHDMQKLKPINTRLHEADSKGRREHDDDSPSISLLSQPHSAAFAGSVDSSPRSLLKTRRRTHSHSTNDGAELPTGDSEKAKTATLSLVTEVAGMAVEALQTPSALNLPPKSIFEHSVTRTAPAESVPSKRTIIDSFKAFITNVKYPMKFIERRHNYAFAAISKYFEEGEKWYKEKDSTNMETVFSTLKKVTAKDSLLRITSEDFNVISLKSDSWTMCHGALPSTFTSACYEVPFLRGLCELIIKERKLTDGPLFIACYRQLKGHADNISRLADEFKKMNVKEQKAREKKAAEIRKEIDMQYEIVFGKVKNDRSSIEYQLLCTTNLPDGIKSPIKKYFSEIRNRRQISRPPIDMTVFDVAYKQIFDLLHDGLWGRTTTGPLLVEYLNLLCNGPKKKGKKAEK